MEGVCPSVRNTRFQPDTVGFKSHVCHLLESYLTYLWLLVTSRGKWEIISNVYQNRAKACSTVPGLDGAHICVRRSHCCEESIIGL